MMRFVIDGYNLMHALSMIPAPLARPARLEPIRERFLHDLATRTGSRCENLTVVFDAMNAGGTGSEYADYRKMTLIYPRHETADDRIETLIKEEPNPATLTVVSDDRRLQLAATRKLCVAMACLEFYEAIGEPVPDSSAAESVAEVEPTITDEEMQHWLNEFGVDPNSEDDLPW